MNDENLESVLASQKERLEELLSQAGPLPVDDFERGELYSQATHVYREMSKNLEKARTVLPEPVFRQYSRDYVVLGSQIE